jgi:hypothetical protein
MLAVRVLPDKVPETVSPNEVVAVSVLTEMEPLNENGLPLLRSIPEPEIVPLRFTPKE